MILYLCTTNYYITQSLYYASLTRFWLFGNEDINGPIPAEIGNMSNLSKLISVVCETERVNFLFKPSLKQYCTKYWSPHFSCYFFSHFTHTELLALFDTGISGDIPDSISNLAQLEVFKVENCNLTGDGWTALFGVPSLTVLGVAGNELITGNLQGIGNLANLQQLYIGETKIGGPLPEELGQLVNLLVIKSPETAFTGAIPSSFGNLKNLTELDFGKNHHGEDIDSF